MAAGGSWRDAAPGRGRSGSDDRPRRAASRPPGSGPGGDRRSSPGAGGRSTGPGSGRGAGSKGYSAPGRGGQGGRDRDQEGRDRDTARDRSAAANDPHIPDEIQADLLDKVVRNSLRTLPEGLADLVGRHLAAAQVALPEDPALALAHAQAAVRRAGRVAVVREAAGVAAYAAGDFGTARTELRAAARISGVSDYLPMLADCERGLGKPEKALELASSAEAERLDTAGKVELLIVAAGARRDLGQDDAAVLTLQVPALRSRTTAPWLPRLRYAYADALLGVGRTPEARTWFLRAAEVDPERLTDSVERVDEIDGVAFDEIEELDLNEEPDESDELNGRAEGDAGSPRGPQRGSQPDPSGSPEPDQTRDTVGDGV